MSYYNIDDKKIEIFKEKVKTEIIEYIQSNDNTFIESLLKPGEAQNEFVQLITNIFIKTEFEVFMGYEPYERGEAIKENYRNGSHTKKFKTTNGTIELKIPEDRNYEFSPSIVQKYQTRSEELTLSLLELFKLGLSNKEVVSFMNNVYGDKYTSQNISNITSVLMEVVDEFKTRAIKKEYFALFIDATYIPVRFNNEYSKEAVYLVCGITSDGYQEIIGYTIGFSENPTLWSELLEDLKSRGLEKVDIFVMDGAQGVDKVVKQHFPLADIQVCTVHVLRNIMNSIKPQDKSEVIAELKNIFLLTDFDLVQSKIEKIAKSYPGYEKKIKGLLDKEYLFTYLKYPPVIHRAIKSTNRIEAVNQKIKSRISHKRLFPSRESLEKSLVAVILELNLNSIRKVNGMEEYLNLNKTK